MSGLITRMFDNALFDDAPDLPPLLVGVLLFVLESNDDDCGVPGEFFTEPGVVVVVADLPDLTCWPLLALSGDAVSTLDVSFFELLTRSLI